MADMKTCGHCHAQKSPVEFYNNKSTPDGKTSWCRACTKAVAAERYKANPAPAKARAAASAAANPERVSANAKKRYAEKRDELASKARAAYAANPQAAKDRVVQWKTSHPERWREIQRAAGAKYQRANPAVSREIVRRRQLRLSSIEKTLTANEWHSICSFYGWGCAYCGDTERKITIDHVVPISRGGNHAADNVVPCCKPCNCAKGGRTPEEWRPRLAAPQ
jgi:5-methylcytosine-specific restriction endonuclease McrA